LGAGGRFDVLPRLRTYVHVREACARQIVARRHVRGEPWGMGERVEIAPGACGRPPLRDTRTRARRIIHLPLHAGAACHV
jgi:hypothetical protein